MNVVTGGAGFIGSHLVEQLLADGEAVRVVEHPRARTEHLPLHAIEVVRADIRDAAAIREAMTGCTHVYHLAADPNLWRRRRSEFDDVNRRGTENVLRAALAAHAERIVHTSTESILTTRASAGGAVEHLRLQPGDMVGPYCLSKYHAERVAFELAEQGAPIVVVAPTLPVGPGDRLCTPPTRMAVALCRGELPAYLECRLNLVDVRDVALGMIRAAHRGRRNVRYLLGGSNHLLSEWLTLLARLCDRPAPCHAVPYPVALAAAWLSERWADHVSGRMPLATVTGVRLTRRNMHFDPSATLRELDLVPRPIERSARDAVAWYRAQGWLAPAAAGDGA